jgi:2-polyprenyl-3-methyl-5-hydroxy-6-metoxy-1,4-benzoquinol methylase
MIKKYYHFNNTAFESHSIIINEIKEDSKVMDIGCSSGYIAKKLKKKNCRVWGVDKDHNAIVMARKYCEEVVEGDIERIIGFPIPKKFFDYILILDVLEHLIEPRKTLKLIKPYLKNGGEIIISVPNIAFISIRLALFRGKFNYQKMGILDETHLRFFTQETLLSLISKSGLRLKKVDYSSGFSQITVFGKYLNYIPKYWQYKITKIFSSLLAYQFIAFCELP